MGIKTNPGYTLCGIGNSCFSGSCTPKKLYVSLSGIQQNPDWGPDLPGPPNGTFVCEQVTSAGWLNNNTDWVIQLVVGPDGSGLSVWTSPSIFAFLFDTDDACVFAGSNQLGLEAPYYGGRYQVCYRPDTGQSQSLKNTLSDIGLDPAKDTYAEFFPVDDDYFVQRFARDKDKTCIKVKRSN